MKPKDTVEKAFRFEETEIVPYWISPGGGELNETPMYKGLNQYYGNRQWQDRIVPYMCGSHAVHGAPLSVELGNDRSRNAFGAVYQQGKVSMVLDHPLKTPSLKGYTWPAAEDLADWNKLRKNYEAAEDSYRLCGMAYGLFERSWELRGIEDLLIDMIDNPDFVDELMGAYADLAMRVIDLIVDNIPCDGIIGGGDDCDQRGPIMGIERWRRFIKPRMAKVVSHVHDQGKPYVAHMCGNFMPEVDDLIEIGVDGFESLQAEALDVYELKNRVQGKVWLIGGLGVQSTMHFGTPDEVKFETKRLIRELGKGGGYVLATSKPLMEDVPVENMAAFVETALQES